MGTVTAIRKKPEYTMMNRANDSYPIDQQISEIIHEGFSRIITDADVCDFIKAANRLIKERLGSNIDIHGPLGVVSITDKIGLEITDYPKLASVFDGNINGFTRRDGSINAERLISIACDADDPRAKHICKCISIRTITNINWRPNNDLVTRH